MLWLLFSCRAPQPASDTEVRPGIDVLLTDSVHLVADRSVGLLTNQTGVDQFEVSDIDRLLQANVELTAIFSPEHGFGGELDQEGIGHATDSATGLPIYSLYGEHRAPTREMLAGIEVLLIDLQDIGARPYTYASTTLLAMGSAARANIPVVILDRPNPIGGELMQGPVLMTEFASFVGMLALPLRHGMTIGELALLGNAELGLGAQLAVVPAAGWRRDRWFDSTSLPWLRPSPNMPDLESASHYPGLVLFEGTNLSVGRGTPIAFQVVAAPWLDAPDLASRLEGQPGVVVSDTLVIPRAPSDGKYADHLLPAIRLHVSDRNLYNPVRLALEVLVLLRESYPDSFEVRNEAYFNARAGYDSLWIQIRDGRHSAEIWRSWREPLAEFARRRGPYLLYH